MARRQYKSLVLYSPPRAAAEPASPAEAAETEKHLDRLKSQVRKMLVEIEAIGMGVVREPRFNPGFSLYKEIERFEIGLIEQALIRTGGHQKRAADLLGIRPTTLHNKLKKYKIDCGAESEDFNHNVGGAQDNSSAQARPPS